MKVELEDKDLEELILTGKNKKYKKVARVKDLKEGLLRAYNYLLDSLDVEELSSISRLKYEKLKYE